MRFKKIIQLFKNGNVCVCGLRGTGKDLLFGNVIVRRNKAYISNLYYGLLDKYTLLDFNLLNLNNSYKNLIENDIKYYEFKGILGADVYLSDAGVYLPSQYCNELNKFYPYIATYQALSRQVSHNNFHINVQNLNRVYDKVREQSDIYIRCRKCIYLFGFVIQFITLYDKYESCLARVKPCKITTSFLSKKENKLNVNMYRDNFYNNYGSVKNRILFYRNRSKHNTYYFQELFKNGKK